MKGDGDVVVTGDIATTDGDGDPADSFGSGTLVSGILADCTPGLDVKILPVRVLDA